MKTGICSSSYTGRFGFEEGIRRIHRLGYDCIDYQGFVDTEQPLFRLPEKEFESFLLSRKNFIAEEGLEISQAHGPWRWPVHDATEEERNERFEKMSRAIRGTALLGCPYFVIHPIMPRGCSQDPCPRKTHDLNLEFFTRLTRIAEMNQVTICYENMPMPALGLASPEACMNFAKEMDSPCFKVCLDTGHCSIVGMSPGDAVRMLGKDMLRVLHVHDNNGSQDLHWIPYTGVIDWEDFKLALQDIGFDGTLSLETMFPPKFTGENLLLQERSLLLSAKQLAGQTA